jgi:hypothetical protein
LPLFHDADITPYFIFIIFSATRESAALFVSRCHQRCAARDAALRGSGGARISARGRKARDDAFFSIRLFSLMLLCLHKNPIYFFRLPLFSLIFIFLQIARRAMPMPLMIFHACRHATPYVCPALMPPREDT